MIKRFGSYLNNAYEYARPYARKTLSIAYSAANEIKKDIKKSQKKNKRMLKFIKIKNFIELAANFVLIKPAFLALVFMIIDFLKTMLVNRKEK